MRLAYNLSTTAYHWGIRLAAPFNAKAKKWVEGRKNWQQNLQKQVDDSAQYAWFHCASLGEFEQGRPVIEAFRLQFPSWKILLTFYSPSGFEVRKNYQGADIVCYLPPDSEKNAQAFLKIVDPKLAVFVKYEFWFHYLNQLHRQKIPTCLISAIFREEQHFFKWYGDFSRKMLGLFNHLFVQDNSSEKLLKQHGIEAVTVCGDTRFDRVAQVARMAEPVPEVAQFCKGSKVLVVGSSWPKDEAILSEVWKSAGFSKMIIAPHEVHEKHIEEILNRFENEKVVRFSGGFHEEWSSANILVVDTIGLLGRIYRYGGVAYIGGGFGSGIHNILEAATFGLPVVFGPNYQRFREAVELIEIGGARSVDSSTALKEAFEILQPTTAGKTAAAYVQTNTGATEKILNHFIEELT